MPIERREILFDYKELTDLIAGTSALKIFLPKAFAEPKVTDICHTRTYDRLPAEAQRKFAQTYQRLADRDAVLVRVRGKDPDGKDVYDIFGIPDSALLPVLIMECRKRKIVLPRSATKTVIVSEIYAGLQMTFGKAQATGLQILEI
jgi:hypothetical protein